MKTPNLDNEINKLEVYKSNDILSEQGEDLLKEFKEIKAKINYTQCCEPLKEKEGMTFDDWCKANNYTQKFLYFFNKNGKSFEPHEVHKRWRTYVDNL
jgi:hypothetical protein